MDESIKSVCIWYPVGDQEKPEAIALANEVARDCILKDKAYGVISIGETPNDVTYRTKDGLVFARKVEDVLYLQVMHGHHNEKDIEQFYD
jgi:hypothetical protein